MPRLSLSGLLRTAGTAGALALGNACWGPEVFGTVGALALGNACWGSEVFGTAGTLMLGNACWTSGIGEMLGKSMCSNTFWKDCANAETETKRSSGFFANVRRITASRSGWIDGLRVLGGSGSVLMCRYITCSKPP